MRNKRIHAMRMDLVVLCGTRHADRTSVVMDAKDKEFWKLVTCQRCKRLRKKLTG